MGRTVAGGDTSTPVTLAGSLVPATSTGLPTWFAWAMARATLVSAVPAPISPSRAGVLKVCGRKSKSGTSRVSACASCPSRSEELGRVWLASWMT